MYNICIIDTREIRCYCVVLYSGRVTSKILLLYPIVNDGSGERKKKNHNYYYGSWIKYGPVLLNIISYTRCV